MKNLLLVGCAILSAFSLELRYDHQRDHPSKGSHGPRDGKCLQKNCAKQNKACDKACRDVLGSCRKCGRDSACWQKCLTDAKNDNAINFAKCGRDNKCWQKKGKSQNSDQSRRRPQQCLKKNCSTQDKACDIACRDVLGSCRKCGRDSACWQKCLTDAKNVNAINFAKCGRDNQCWK